MAFNYTFPAVRGIQANSEYFICMIPCSLLSKLFIEDRNDISPEYRAQRKVNYLRIPEMKKYILSNRDSYVFSALAASIDGDFEFKALDESGLGLLEVDMNAKFLINDGQHRKTAIEEAIIEDKSISKETIPVVFFKDQGLKKCQQMFTDLNKHAVNTSKSLNTLYDSKDEVAVISTKIVDTIPFFKRYTDKENDTLGKFSQKLFTLSNFYRANKNILEKHILGENEKEFIEKYWLILSKNITEWNLLQSNEITKKSLREDYIITQGTVLLAFGKLGNYLLNNKQINIEKCLEKLNNINWLRSNDQWDNKAIINGKIARSDSSIKLTYIEIKKELGLEITEIEKLLMKKYEK